MNQFRIAIVDTDTAQRKFIEESIREVFQVVSFAKGEDFLKTLKPHVYDLVLLGFKIEDYNPLEFQKKIEKNLPSQRVVLLSTFDRSRSTIQSVKRRAMDYLYLSDEPKRFLHDLCKQVRFLIDEENRKKVETLLKGTDLFPLVQQIYDERNVDVETLKAELAALKKKK